MTAQQWTYEFYSWPDQDKTPAMYRLFELVNHSRFVEDFTERDFGNFRLELESQGILLKEISRTPAVEPEIVL